MAEETEEKEPETECEHDWRYLFTLDTIPEQDIYRCTICDERKVVWIGK